MKFKDYELTGSIQKKRNQNETGASERKLWLRLDFVVIFILLAAALGFYALRPGYFQDGEALVCEIILDGETVMSVELQKDREFSLDALPNVVFGIHGGAAAFIHSDCPDKICVLSGYLRQAGQMAVCLPNHVAIRISGKDAPDIVI